MAFPPDMGPRAPYRNLPPVPQYFSPSVFFITAITNGIQTTITTATTHNYVLGQQITCLIPPTYKEIQLNRMQGFVTSIPSSTQVIVNIDSINFDIFNPSPAYGPTKPQIIAVGDINTGISANSDGNKNNGTTIPGSFINTSPIKGSWLN
jgi:hypothetical protein